MKQKVFEGLKNRLSALLIKNVTPLKHRDFLLIFFTFHGTKNWRNQTGGLRVEMYQVST